jgi:multisubunit Na+/H+ antiporter MnhG subunit
MRVAAVASRLVCDHDAMKPARSRFLLFIARWAVLSGLAGIVFTVLVWRERTVTKLEGQRGLLLAAAVLLSVAFILAPFVRRALAEAARSRPKRATTKTLLDEIREQEGVVATEDGAAVRDDPSGSIVTRLIVALYIVFAITLAVDLWLL